MAKANQKARKYLNKTKELPRRADHPKEFPVMHQHYTQGDTGYVPRGNRNKH